MCESRVYRRAGSVEIFLRKYQLSISARIRFNVNFKGHQKGDSGYKIYYPDGYISWCPKEVFEKQYLKLESEEEVKDNDVRNYIYRSGIEKDVDFSYIKFLLKDILKWAKEGLKR